MLSPVLSVAHDVLCVRVCVSVCVQVRAVRHGLVLLVDEADKAPTHVTCVLQNLIKWGEMALSDGRKIVPSKWAQLQFNSALTISTPHR